MEESRLPPPEGSRNLDLTIEERNIIQHIERLGASISLVSVCLIFAAYGLSKRVRTLPNTFIFFASIANVGASIACLIGYAGISAGLDSALCQGQAFLLEMFMQSDPWWSFAMAVNVYMVFFMSYPTSNFHKHLWIYCLICFGIPAVPAFVCLLYAPNGKRIYGNATLWCWIDEEYNPLRIFTYYLPIWMCIVLTAVIYVAVGCRVFRQRNQLRNLTLSNQANDSYSDEPGAVEKGGQAYGMVTTEVQVTAESSTSPTPPSTPSGSIDPVLQRPPPAAHVHDPWGKPDDDGARPPSSYPNHHHNHHYPQHQVFTTTSTISSAGAASSARPKKKPNLAHPRRPRAAAPIHPQTPSATHAQNRGTTILTPLARFWRRFCAKLANLDPVKLGYLRTSFLFALSILATWTPSSINRVYALAYPSRPASYPLNLAGAVVLPLQGLWNAVIFVATTWATLREEVAEVVAKWVSSSSSRGRKGTGRNRRASVGFGMAGLGVGGRRERRDDSGSAPRRGVDDGEDDDGRDEERELAISPAGSRRSGMREARALPPISRGSMWNVRVIKGGSL